MTKSILLYVIIFFSIPTVFTKNCPVIYVIIKMNFSSISNLNTIK